MEITFTLNGKKVTPQIDADTLLIDLVRDLGCYSVKRGCETSNCGLCTVFMDDQPILSCSILAARVDGHKIDTLEGLQEEAAEFGAFIANQGAEQCGFCNPGMIMNAIALFRELSLIHIQIGYSGDIYHSWISTWLNEKGWVDNIIQFDGKSWELMDPTLAANSDNKEDVKEYIGNGEHYVLQYSY